MQAEAIVMNPCFYKGFFSTADNLRMAMYFCFIHTESGLEYTKNYFRELINLEVELL